MTNWLSAHPALDATTPRPVTLGAATGSYVDVQLAADWNQTCSQRARARHRPAPRPTELVDLRERKIRAVRARCSFRRHRHDRGRPLRESERFPRRLIARSGARRGVVRVPQVSEGSSRILSFRRGDAEQPPRSAQTFLGRPRERRNRIDRSGKEEGMRRMIGWALVSVGLAGVITAMTLTPGVATPPSGLALVPLARGSNTSDGTLPLKAGTDVAIAQITVTPGGSSGWHSHPGGAIVRRPAGLAHAVPIGRRPVPDQELCRGAGVRRATRRGGSGHQHGRGPVCPGRHLPARACGCVDEDRRARPGHVSRSLTTRPSATPRTWGVALTGLAEPGLHARVTRRFRIVEGACLVIGELEGA